MKVCLFKSQLKSRVALNPVLSGGVSQKATRQKVAVLPKTSANLRYMIMVVQNFGNSPKSERFPTSCFVFLVKKFS